jgi:S1-C subfamily serine protease
LESVPKPKIAPQATPTPGNPFLNNPFKSSPFGNDPFGGDSSPFGQPNTGTPRRTGAAHFGAMVTPVTNDLRAQFHIPADQSGAIVVSTEQGSVAEMVGLLSGDLITSFNGSTVKSADDLVTALHGIKWGDNVSISYSRWSPGGTITTVTKKFAFK